MAYPGGTLDAVALFRQPLALASGAGALLALATMGCSSVAELLGVITSDAAVSQGTPNDTATSDAEVEAMADAGQPLEAGGDAAVACDPSKPFGVPMLLSSLQSPDKEGGFRLLPGERTGFFWSSRDGGPGYINIYTTTRTDVLVPFGGVKLVDNVNVPMSLNMDPTATANGLTLIYRYRMGRTDSGIDQLFAAERADAASAFSNGTPVANVNVGGFNNVQPYVMPDGSALYFSSDRAGDFDIYRAVRVGDTFGLPVAISELNATGANEGDPLLTADELTIYFSSSRSAGLGRADIWMAQRADKGLMFGPPIDLMEINSAAMDAPTWLSPDGCRLYMSSERGDAGNDIYVALRPP
jgi:WD40-like Beta Propeller Repeat